MQTSECEKIKFKDVKWNLNKYRYLLRFLLFSITYHRPRIWTKKFRNIFCKYEMSRTQRFILGIKWCWLCAQLGNIETFPTKWVSQFYNSLAPLLSKNRCLKTYLVFFSKHFSLFNYNYMLKIKDVYQ